jgi:hypothetical protein
MKILLALLLLSTPALATISTVDGKAYPRATTLTPDTITVTTLSVTSDGTIGGQLTVKGTATVQGNAFSVGASTFVVAGGNVGLGTAAPLKRLVVSNSGAAGLEFGVGQNMAGNAESTTNLLQSYNRSGAAYTALDFMGSSFRWGVNGGAETMRFNGSLGIGTTAPGTLLHVASGIFTLNGTGAGFNLAAPGSADTLNRTATTGANSIYDKWVNTGGSYYIGAENSVGNDLLGTANPYALAIRAGATRDIALAPNAGAVAMTLKSGGNVGIGTTAPGTKLHLSSGTVTVDGTASAVVVGTMTIKGSGSGLPQGVALCVTSAQILGYCTTAALPSCTCVAP